MSGSKIQLVCWDSCIFLAWFNKEADKPLGEIERTLRQIVDQKISLIVSAVSYVEVLDVAGKSTAGTEFRGFVKRPNVIVANFDHRLGEIAAKLRQEALILLANQTIQQGVKIPDAMITASAMFFQAAEMHTFDPVLLSLSRRPEVNGMPIIVPNDSGHTELGF